MLMGTSTQPSFLNSLVVMLTSHGQFSKCLEPQMDRMGREQRGSEHATNSKSLKTHSLCVLWNRTKPLRSTLYNPHHPYLRQNLQRIRRMPDTHPSYHLKMLIWSTLSNSFTHFHLFQETKLTFPNQSREDEIFLSSCKGVHEQIQPALPIHG